MKNSIVPMNVSVQIVERHKYLIYTKGCTECTTVYSITYEPLRTSYTRVVVVVVVVDSLIQRIVLATEETTVTQQVSHRPIKCQSRLWPQRGTEVNGSHHGDNPLLRPTGIQIATKSNATP